MIQSQLLFSVLVEELEVQVEVGYNPEKHDILLEFEDFAKSWSCIINKTSNVLGILSDFIAGHIFDIL